MQLFFLAQFAIIKTKKEQSIVRSDNAAKEPEFFFKKKITVELHCLIALCRISKEICNCFNNGRKIAFGNQFPSNVEFFF